jgi:hypothetical protein
MGMISTSRPPPAPPGLEDRPAADAGNPAGPSSDRIRRRAPISSDDARNGLPPDPSVEVPDVRQQTSANAQALLAQVSLRLQVTSTVPTVQPAGIVLTQDPVPGSRVPTGSTISVVLSAGGLAVVPQLVGRTQSVANQQLRALGLDFDSELVPNLARTPGTVLSQDPTAGTAVMLARWCSWRSRPALGCRQMEAAEAVRPSWNRDRRGPDRTRDGSR